MSVQDLYFATMARICDVMEGFSDPVASAAFGRLGHSLSLIGLRTYGIDGVTIDRKGSGLPILMEAAALAIDAASPALSEENPDVLRRQILDHLMTRRRRPPADLMRRMALAVYAKALRGGEATFGCQPDGSVFAPKGPWGGVRGAWDFWDGVASAPVHIGLDMAPLPGCDMLDADVEAAEAARLFSGQAFAPLALARELDERLPGLRLRSLSKLCIGPFRSDVFTEGGDTLEGFLRQAEDVGGGWAMAWTVDQVRSLGTATRRGGLFGLSSRPYERLVVDPQDMHMLMPHPLYQLLSDDPEGRSILSARRVHVLDGASLTEDV